jgi:basic membrane protein A
VRRGALIAAVLLLTTSDFTVHAQGFAPVVVYDGPRNDGSFNASAARGVARFRGFTGMPVIEIEPGDPSEYEKIDRAQALGNYDPIIVVGASHRPAIEKIARELPNARFTLIDGRVDLPNVRSMLFKEHEGSYLMGVVAGLASKSGKVGFIGGMDIPQIRRFQCGYEQGIRFADPRVQLIASMTGTTPAAWRDPARGAKLAQAQFDQGVDVVFAAAGATGLGVLQAAADRHRYAIGVDTNQNHLQPGTVLTSMVKHVDSAIYETLAEAAVGRWYAGAKDLGVAEGGVDWAIDDYNRPLLSDDIKQRVEASKVALAMGTFSVHDYMVDNSCTSPTSRPSRTR